MKPKSISRYFGFQTSSSLALITVCALGSAGLANAQTWTNTTTGTSTWSTVTNWDTNPTAPVSSTTTAIQFFATPSTVIPAASAIVANQDIVTPMILNSLVVNGTGPASGTTPSLTISGGTLQFDGTTPSISLNPGFGTVGYNVILSAPLSFNAPTSINFGSGGGGIATSGPWNGVGAVTFTGSLGNRPLSLTNATGTTFSGDLFLTGNSNTVLQLNAVTGALGPNTATTQAVVVNNNAGVNINYGNAAFNNQQNFVISGNGNTSTTNAAVNISRINFGDCTIGGLAVAADSTFRIAMENASDARVVSASRGIVGSGKLIKTGNGYLRPSVTSPTTPVTWGGTAYSAFTGDVEVRQGALQTPAANNALGPNVANTQRVTVSSGAAMNIAAGNNAWTQPQNFILNGTGTGFSANVGGLAALDSFGAGFGNNTIRRIVVATDSTISARRDGTSSGIGRGLATQVGLAGTGNLTINAPYGTAISPVYLDHAASAFEEFPAFGGKVIINHGILSIGNNDALGTSPTGQITLSSLGALSSGLVGGLNQTFLDRIENLSTTGGAVCLGLASANNLDFTSAPNLRLGAIGSFTYSGTLTPAGGVYRLGGGGGTLTVSSPLAGSNSVVISGSVILSNASNDFNGGITISSNNTGTGQTASLGFTGGTGNLNGNAINFGGAGGSLAYTGAAAGSSDSLGALSFPTGHSNITSTRGAAGNTSLAFSSMAARSAGATGNFTVTGGTNGADNKISISGLSAGFVNQGIFFGGGNYAFNDATGFLRAPVYGADAGFVTSAATTSVASATHQQVTGAISAQNTAAFTTLNIRNTANAGQAFTLTTGATVTSNGILLSGGSGGNSAVTISGGNGLQAATDTELVIRSDGGNDRLTVGTPILANGTSSLTKTGSGTLTLNSANTYTGATTVVAGTLTVGSTGSLQDNSPVTVNGGTYANNSTDDFVGTVTLRNGIIGGSAIHQASAYAVENGMVTARLGGSASLTKTTAGQVILAAANTFTGGTTISGGTLTVSRSSSLDDFSTITIENGASYELGGADTVGDVILANGTIRGPGALNGFNYDVRSGRIEAPLAGTGTITKSTAGTVTLAGVNTLVADIVVSAGTLVLADNAALKFVISGTSSSNTISGSGSATFDGDFEIDLVSGLPDVTPGNEWSLINPTLVESYGTTFNLIGFTVKPDGKTWTRPDGLNLWTFSEDTGKLTYGSVGYSAWASDNLVTEGENGDDDKDGLSNLVEYALGLNPKASSVPAGTFVGNLLTFTKGPLAKTAGDVTFEIETSTSLAIGSWSPAAATDTADTISFQLPPNQPGGRIFARLKVTKP